MWDILLLLSPSLRQSLRSLRFARNHQPQESIADERHPLSRGADGS